MDINFTDLYISSVANWIIFSNIRSTLGCFTSVISSLRTMISLKNNVKGLAEQVQLVNRVEN